MEIMQLVQWLTTSWRGVCFIPALAIVTIFVLCGAVEFIIYIVKTPIRLFETLIELSKAYRADMELRKAQIEKDKTARV